MEVGRLLPYGMACVSYGQSGGALLVIECLYLSEVKWGVALMKRSLDS